MTYIVPKRIFVDWTVPPILSLVDYALTNATTGELLDLHEQTWIFSGRRGLRRFLDLLIRQSEARGIRLLPPKTLTAGGLPEFLSGQRSSTPSTTEELLCWQDAIASISHEKLTVLIRTESEKISPNLQHDLAHDCQNLRQLLATANLGFADVAEHPSMLAGQGDERWGVLAAIEEHYRKNLEALHCTDLYTQRQDNIASKTIFAPGSLVLAAVSDLAPVHKLFLSLSRAPITALICAPESYSEGFDEFGGLQEAFWKEQPLPLEKAKLLQFEGEGAELAGLCDEISLRSHEVCSSELSIAFTDETLLKMGSSLLRELGAPVHTPGLRPLSESRFGQVAQSANHCIAERTFSSLLAFISLPPIHDYLDRMVSFEASDTSIISILEHFQERHLHALYEETLGGNPGESLRQDAQLLLDAVNKLFRPLEDPSTDTVQSCRVLFDFFMQLTEAIDQDAADGESVDQQCLASITAVLEEFAHSSALRAAMLAPRDVLALLIERLQGITPSERTESEPIECLGWLELFLDEAPHVLILGCNEGKLPETITSHRFLPDSLRAKLGLASNLTRFCRDLYQLRVHLESRDSVTLFVARRGLAENPLLPSRLLYSTQENKRVEQLEKLFTEQGNQVSLLRSAVSESELFTPFIPDRSCPLPKTLPVRALDDYRKCPYRFYLQHVLGVKSFDPFLTELPLPALGTLLHDALHCVALDSSAPRYDKTTLTRALTEGLEKSFRARVGSDSFITTMLQFEGLRRRLPAVADAQLHLQDQGWELRHSEFALSPAPLSPALADCAFSGRIDRLDWNSREKRWGIFDYKLSDSSNAHAVLRQYAPQFIDGEVTWGRLQLVAYAKLLRQMGFQEPLSTGLIIISAADEITFEEHLLDEDDLASAQEAIDETCGGIAAGNFWPPSEHAFANDPFEILFGKIELLSDENDLSEGEL